MHPTRRHTDAHQATARLVILLLGLLAWTIIVGVLALAFHGGINVESALVALVSIAGTSTSSLSNILNSAKPVGETQAVTNVPGETLAVTDAPSGSPQADKPAKTAAGAPAE